VRERERERGGRRKIEEMFKKESDGRSKIYFIRCIEPK
jgi:hypothetical protein